MALAKRIAALGTRMVNRGLKIGAGQRSRSMALAKWIAASGDENGGNGFFLGGGWDFLFRIV